MIKIATTKTAAPAILEYDKREKHNNVFIKLYCLNIIREVAATLGEMEQYHKNTWGLSKPLVTL